MVPIGVKEGVSRSKKWVAWSSRLLKVGLPNTKEQSKERELSLSPWTSLEKRSEDEAHQSLFLKEIFARDGRLQCAIISKRSFDEFNIQKASKLTISKHCCRSAKLDAIMISWLGASDFSTELVSVDIFAENRVWKKLQKDSSRCQFGPV